MTVDTFQSLPVDVLFEIFGYLSPVNILQSFLSINKRLSRIIICEYLWHIDIGDSTMSSSMFNDICQNVLKLIGSRLVSLRVILSNTIGGWSLVSSSLGYHQTTLLQRLHLIDIKPHEFDKLLRNHLIKQLHTLLVDITVSNPFNYLEIEGVYLNKVCSQLPLLAICRLPFNVYHKNLYQLEEYSGTPLMSLPNLSNTTHLRSLTIGMNTSYFLKRLLSCIPFIENLSLGVNDEELKAYTSIFDPWIISGDTIQQFCIDQLEPLATYNLNLLFNIEGDLEEKIIFNSFSKVPFTDRQHPRVFIQERDSLSIGHNYHCFMVYTLPYYDRVISTHAFTSDLQISSQKLVNPINLFSRTNELFINGFTGKSCHLDLGNCRSSISALVPWTLLTKIRVDDGNVISAAELEAILRMAYHVHTLQIDDSDGLSGAIFCNTDNLGTRVNEQIRSFIICDCTLTLYHAQHFCILLCNRLFNLKNISFNIYDSYSEWTWKPSCIVDGENESTKRIVNLIYLLVDHLQQLVSLQINFVQWLPSDTPCFPRLIRRQLHQRPLNRPYRLRCSSYSVQIWL
ncbi:unnamed protein product [Rotaria sp. Silwood2]|nr:unnamed protein product [Rotaria sp. Silwood2]